MKILSYSPKKYEGSDVESVAKALHIGYVLLPAFLSIALIRQLILGEYDIAIVIAISLGAAFFIRWQFLRGHLRSSVMIVSVFFTFMLTLTCSLGNGIHDIGLIGFPIIIGFSSIILDQKQLLIASILSVMGLAWLVVGERFDFFTPVHVPTGTAGDLLIASLFIILGGYVAFSLTNNMRHSLQKAQGEVDASRKEANALFKEIEENEEIIVEVHRTVMNSLGHIQQLVNHKRKDLTEINPSFESLDRKIMVIEEAHHILLKKQAPILLSINELTRSILNRYEKALSTPVLHIDIGKNDCIMRLDQAINYGICLVELVHELDELKCQSLKISMEFKENVVGLILQGFTGMEFKELSIVMDLLTKQLKGELVKTHDLVSLTFKPQIKE